LTILIDHLARKTVAPMPEVTGWTPLAFVVNAFLVRTTDDTPGHDDRGGAVFFDEFQDFPGDALTSPDVTCQACISSVSAPSEGMIPTATFVAWLRFGP